MTKQPSNKSPKQNPKPKKSEKKKTLWDTIVDVAVILAGIGGLASLFFIYSYFVSEGEKPKADFKYRIVANTPFGNSKFTNYWFVLTNTGTKEPLQVHTIQVRFDRPIISYNSQYVDPIGCKMFETPNKFGVTIRSDDFGVPAGKYFFFTICTTPGTTLETASVIPSKAKPTDAIFLDRVEWSPDLKSVIGDFGRVK